jgi:regulator of sigma E protease
VIKPVIGGFTPPGYPAEKAGLQIGDQIIAIDGTQIMHWFQLVRIVSAHPDEELQITVLRDGKEIDFAITPKDQDGDGKLGIELQQQTVLKKHGVLESISLGIKRSWELTTLTIDLLKRLVTRRASVKTVGGPIMIAQMSGQVVREGIAESLSFMGLVSLSLGIFNLLPIPILDGGHIFLLLVEILYRRPLRMREREIAQKIGLLILIPLMLFVFYNDIARVLGL